MTTAAAGRSVGCMDDMQHTQRTARPDCQVLVVGAGPTGLVLAVDLLARGVSTRIIDKGDGVNLETRAIGLTDEAAGVTARVRDAGGQTHVITAGYVVGCDGAHSRVRHELGLRFQGHPYPQAWLLADVRLDWARPEDVVHAFFRADGLPLVCFPMRDHTWRLVVPFAGDRAPGAPDLGEIQHLVDQRAPERVVVSDPTWLASFNCHRRSTNVYRRGHVLLAGDAVHIHTPAGGQGMNTGITDAHNLGWKLALVAADRAPGQLLDTYGREREPVAAQVLGLTHALVRFGTVTHPVKRALRDAIVPAAFQVGPVHRRAVRRWTQVNVAYPASSLTRPDRSRRRPRPGQRVPDIEVRTQDGTSRLFTVLRRGRHVMVVTGADPDSVLASPALEPYRDLFEVITRSSGEARVFRGGRAGSVFLVRPDGYIAARGRPDRLEMVLGYFQELCRQRIDGEASADFSSSITSLRKTPAD